MYKRKFFAVAYTIMLLAFTVFITLDTFVIEKSYATLDTVSNTSENVDTDSESTISINTYRQYDSDIYIADIILGEDDSIYSALADNTYGSNITETTSSMAESTGAALAINGDFYGVQNSGYVIRNGELLRDTIKSDDQEDLVIYEDGTMDIIQEGDISADELISDSAYNVWSFGPGLIEDGEISVSGSDETDGARSNTNPRTAIGYIDENHYVFVVVDGRTDTSEGVTLYELAEFMDSLGCTEAYNLDGGGSSTMYYDGELVNTPTTNGSDTSEREVSDIVYIY